MGMDPIAGVEDALLRTIGAARISRQTLEALIEDTGCSLDEEIMAAVRNARAIEDLAMAYLEAHAARCPGCRQAFVFQRQTRHPSRCSWCGRDHETGAGAELTPA